MSRHKCLHGGNSGSVYLVPSAILAERHHLSRWYTYTYTPHTRTHLDLDCRHLCTCVYVCSINYFVSYQHNKIVLLTAVDFCVYLKLKIIIHSSQIRHEIEMAFIKRWFTVDECMHVANFNLTG